MNYDYNPLEDFGVEDHCVQCDSYLSKTGFCNFGGPNALLCLACQVLEFEDEYFDEAPLSALEYDLWGKLV